MVIYRTNAGRSQPSAASGGQPVTAQHNPTRPTSGSPSPPSPSDAPGDVIYGARAIAAFIFSDDSNRARRRVFHLWAHYRDRKEKAGFFKLKGALCLSKSQWRAFHGLG